MWKFITDNVREFWRGTIAFSFTGFGFITFQKIIIIDVLVGVLVTIMSGVVGGMATALGAYYFKNKLQHRLFKTKKKKENEQQQRSDESEERVA